MKIVGIISVLLITVSCAPAMIPLEVEIAEDIVENIKEDIQKHESKK